MAQVRMVRFVAGVREVYFVDFASLTPQAQQNYNLGGALIAATANPTSETRAAANSLLHPPTHPVTCPGCRILAAERA